MIIGTCGICGGPVNTNMEGVGYCQRCGARVRNPYGPRLPMEPNPYPPSYFPFTRPSPPYINY